MNASEQPRPLPARYAPTTLWRAAEAFMHTLCALFGNPEDVAFRHTLTRAPYRLLLSWIRCGEAMLRRLLLIEAAAYPKPNTRPVLWPKRARARRLMTFSAEAPHEWRVSFRIMERRRPRRREPKPAGEAPACANKRVSREDRWSYENFKPQSFHSAWPLAERYEAMLRVFANPAPYARRLAALLYALPHRIVEVLRAPAEAAERVPDFTPLTHAAESAVSVAFNSS